MFIEIPSTLDYCYVTFIRSPETKHEWVKYIPYINDILLFLWPGLEQDSSWFSSWIWFKLYSPVHCTTPFVDVERWNVLFLLIISIYTDASYFVSSWQFIMTKLSKTHAGEEDPRCPMAGLDVTISRTQKAFEDAYCSHSFKVFTNISCFS